MTTFTAEEEYMDLGLATQESVWISRVLKIAAENSIESEPIIVDNWSSIKMAKTDISGNRTKHIDIKYHLVCHLLRVNQFRLRL